MFALQEIQSANQCRHLAFPSGLAQHASCREIQPCTQGEDGDSFLTGDPRNGMAYWVMATAKV